MKSLSLGSGPFVRLRRLPGRVWLISVTIWTAFAVIVVLQAWVLQEPRPGASLSDPLYRSLTNALYWAVLSPVLYAFVSAQPPLPSGSGRLLALNGSVALALPWLHAPVALGLDVLAGHATLTLSTYATSSFDLDILAFLGIVATAQVSAHALETQQAEIRRGKLTATVARAEAEAARLLAEPAHFVRRLGDLRAMIDEAPRRAEDAVAFLGDFLRHSLLAAGRSEIPLSEELSRLRADLAFEAALHGRQANLLPELAEGTEAALVPNGILLDLLGDMHRALPMSSDISCRVVARWTGSGLHLSVITSEIPPVSPRRSPGPAPAELPRRSIVRSVAIPSREEIE